MQSTMVLAAVLLATAVALPSSALAQSRSGYQVRGALFGSQSARGIEAASHKEKENEKETQRRSPRFIGNGPEAALLAAAGIISPISYGNLPLCDDNGRDPFFDCQILFKKRQKPR
jgi:hypothetical protein